MVTGGYPTNADMVVESSDELELIDDASSGSEREDADTSDERWDLADYLFGSGSNDHAEAQWETDSTIMTMMVVMLQHHPLLMGTSFLVAR